MPVADDDATVLAGLVAEMQALAPMELVLRPLSAFTLAGLLQLASRHAGLGAEGRTFITSFLTGVRTYFADCPTVLEALRRGDDPREDR